MDLEVVCLWRRSAPAADHLPPFTPDLHQGPTPQPSVMEAEPPPPPPAAGRSSSLRQLPQVWSTSPQPQRPHHVRLENTPHSPRDHTTFA